MDELMREMDIFVTQIDTFHAQFIKYKKARRYCPALFVLVWLAATQSPERGQWLQALRERWNLW